jgi:hypothetical protein
MTSLADLTPMVDVLPPTKQGKARAIEWYADMTARGWQCEHLAVVKEQGKPRPDHYGVDEFPAADPGRAFHVRKEGGNDRYDVFCADAGEGWDTCSCAGGCYRRTGIQACRHLASIRAALSNGWIAPRAEDVPGDDGGDWYSDEELVAMAAEYAAEELARLA